MTERQLFQQYLALPSEVPDPIEAVKAEGIYIYDNKGNPYVDLVSGVSVSNLGHCNKYVVEAVKQQVETYMHLMVYGKYLQSPQVQLAYLLAQNLPESLNSTYFVNSGSEAIDGALKLAKRYTGRSEIIAFKNAYHGGTHGALSILGNEKMKYAYRPLLPDIRFLDFNISDQLDQITEKTACVVMEPIQAEAGIIIPTDAYLKTVRQRCDETGALLIFDEIQMGFGRTGKLFAFENFNIVPDVICLAKAMGGGMPIGAFISSKEKMNTLTFKPDLGHITTFGGHPVCCAAALANLEVLTTTDYIKLADDKGKRFVEGIKNHPLIGEIRQIGLMLGIDIKDKTKAVKLSKVFQKNLLIVDQFLFKEDAFRIAPPLIITNEEIDAVIEKILISLDQL
ncbi:MAG: aspartate aminotransferase family protein [Bacteroidales bacterium]|nr:aspartate aminotransferase family protein [Bacteroidales bacterium]